MHKTKTSNHTIHNSRNSWLIVNWTSKIEHNLAASIKCLLFFFFFFYKLNSWTNFYFKNTFDLKSKKREHEQ